MALFEWKKEYNTTLSSVDEQHKRLVYFMNDFHEVAVVNKQNMELIKCAFDKLALFTIQHFKYEEMLFETHQYPLTKEHLKEHENLINNVLKLQKDISNHKFENPDKVMDFLKNWLVNHIKGNDFKYVDHLQKNGVK